jgi:uncharacterized protein YxeA
MKKIMIAALGLSLLPVGALFAQNTSTSTDTMKSTKKSKKSKKKTDTTSTTSTSSK